MNIEDIYKTIDVIVTNQQKARKNNDYLTLLLNAEALLERIPTIINYSVEQESEYRKFEAKIADEKDENGKRNSGAYAETKAKATDYYKDWQKSKLFMDMIYEMINLSKKLAGSVDKELNVQTN